MLVVTLGNLENITYPYRKDIKRPHWVAISNCINDNPNLYSLTGDEFKALFQLLCDASKQCTNEVRINIQQYDRAYKISNNALHGMLDKLLITGVILKFESLEKANPYGSVRDPGESVRYTTLQDTTLQNTRTLAFKKNDVKNLSQLHRVAEKACEPALEVVTKAKQVKQQVAVAPRAAGKTSTASQLLSKAIWESFYTAYLDRWKVEPARNAKVNMQVKQLGERLGEDAPDVVKFFIAHNDDFYLRKMHQIGLCLRDAEALHAQWKRGRAVTGRDVRNFEKKLDEVTQPPSVDSEARELAAKIQGAISKFGYTNGSLARAYLGETSWAVVTESGGWGNLCRNLGTSINLQTFLSQTREVLKKKMNIQSNESAQLKTLNYSEKKLIGNNNQQGDENEKEKG